MGKIFIMILGFLYSVNVASTILDVVSPEIKFVEPRQIELSKDSILKLVGPSEVFQACVKADAVLKDTASRFYYLENNYKIFPKLWYEGWICAEGIWSVYWDQNSDKTINLMGKVIGLWASNSDSGYLSTYAPGCCADFNNYVHIYRVIRDTAILVKSIAILDVVEIPKEINISKKIVIENISYNLRAQPWINDSIDTADVEMRDMKGNAFANIPSGAKLNVTSSIQDGTGRTWWFVIEDSKGEKNYALCGWISTKKLLFHEVDK